MTKETKNLSLKIKKVKEKKENKKSNDVSAKFSGYQIITEVVVDLLGCVLIGASLGIISQNLFGTTQKLTVALTMLGGIAGIYSVIKYAMSLSKKG